MCIATWGLPSIADLVYLRADYQGSAFMPLKVVILKGHPVTWFKVVFLLRRSSSLQVLQFGCLSIRFGSSRQAAVASPWKFIAWKPGACEVTYGLAQCAISFIFISHLSSLKTTTTGLSRRHERTSDKCVKLKSGNFVELLCLGRNPADLQYGHTSYCCSWQHCFSAVQWQVSSTTTSPLPECVLRCDRCWGSRRTDQLSDSSALSESVCFFSTCSEQIRGFCWLVRCLCF